jgi:hypothetical protein
VSNPHVPLASLSDDDLAAFLADQQDAYQALRDEKLGALPGVQRLTSTIVMKRVVEDRPYLTGS